ncbi:MAG TPA: LLM class flavin-dependent oxidoreductase, partial [Candidatus Binataceae bacterium]|nr:LLM class flavin-dependent oxidoreductase [Candidatus Binataceae bacterium]
VRVGPCVAAVAFRSPPLLAKITSTLDHLSNGRLILGLGAGWQRSEYDAHNYPYPSNAERLAQLGEAIKVIKAMWTQEEPTYHGRYFSIEKAYNNPRPIQKPHPPIMLGGSGSGLLKIAAADADIVNFIPPIFNGKDFPNDPQAAVDFDNAALKKRIAMLQRFAQEAGRNSDQIELSGLVIVNMANDKSQADAVVRETAKSFSFPDEETARRAPVFLMGTPDEVKRELRWRIEEFGITYYMVVPMSDESHQLFVQRVMPEFVRKRN